MKNGFEFVESVRAPAEDVEQEVYFAGRIFFERGHRRDHRCRPALVRPAGRAGRGLHEKAMQVSDDALQQRIEQAFGSEASPRILAIIGTADPYTPEADVRELAHAATALLGIALILLAMGWRSALVVAVAVPVTLALTLIVWISYQVIGIKAKGLGGWTKELFVAPFGSFFLLWPVNFLFQMVEFISKPLSHSLRLYGNMYAGEIIFILLGMWAATGVVGIFFGAILSLGWSIFHILIVVLQAYIFMMLTIVYLAMAEEHH